MRRGSFAWLFPVLAVALGLTGCGGGEPSNAVPADTKVLVALPLKVRSDALGGLAAATADSQNRAFRRFRTTAQIAASFGASKSTIAANQKVLARDGLKLVPDPTHGALWGTVTAAQAKQHFGTTLVTESGKVGPATDPDPPAGLKG